MAGPGRNDRCGCGSGRKVKRCCGQRKGPSDRALAEVYLTQVSSDYGEDALLGLVEHGRDALIAELVNLPRRHNELLVPLPRLLPPRLLPLRAAVMHDDWDAVEAALPAALSFLDVPEVRAGLARIVLALREQVDLHLCVAAFALVDLHRSGAILLKASLVQAMAVAVGRSQRASGLYLSQTTEREPQLTTA